ncbi:MAG: 3-oxoacyl-[acyl-carrier protein] reductase [Thermomicrobiales bacterium]|nr:3-oxoacyl-[acyl-carrier protein] reductase [Thermomicrobiales bacterium]MEA2528908.1 3-oxoacyl-[acyl-carrier protein] reductase [Thermomicrobiales bacterium]
MGKLDGKIALVTGASRGIGREIALAFAREGADVACNYNKSPAAAESLVAAIEAMGRRAVAIQGDVGKPEEIERMVNAATETFGRIDVLVNNAGFLNVHPIAEMPLGVWDELIAAHLRGTFLTTQLVLPQMLERRSGRIINIASQLAYKGRAGLAHYCAAKAGIIAFTRVLALEVSRHGVYANCIAPGPIATEIMPRTGPPDPEEEARFADTLPIGRLGTVEEVAPTAVFLASDDSTYYVGQTLGPNGGDVML